MKKIKKGNNIKEKKIGEKRKEALYLAEIFGLLLLVTVAFLAPKLLLELQDNVRSGKVLFSEAEDMDITSFNTGYEENFYKRMLRFAEETKAGQQFYVASQEVTDTSEIESFLRSDKGFYQDKFLMFLDGDFIPEETLYYSLQQCRQYVIYGDDFSKGVNFILWYVELWEEGSPTLKLLIDAETGDFYGICFRDTEENLIRKKFTEDIKGYSLRDYFGVWTDSDMLEMWLGFAYYFGGLEESEIYRMAEERYEVNAYMETPYMNNGMATDEGAVKNVFDYVKWECSEDQNQLDFLFPYTRGGSAENVPELRFRMEADWAAKQINSKSIYFTPKTFLLGFPDIYHHISEFSE